MLNSQRITDEALVCVSSLAEVSVHRDQIREIISQWGLAILRGLVDRQNVNDGKSRLASRFHAEFDQDRQPKIGIGHEDFQRFDNGAKGSISRLTRTFFCFYWNEDEIGLRPAFQVLSAARNILAGFPKNMSQPFSDSLEFYDGPRILQYPKGGGFISAHCDALPQGLRSLGESHFQNYTTLLVMTRIGTDFLSGGGWVETRNGCRALWEPFVELGDVVVYDNSTLHGVDPVDEKEPLELAVLNGRLVANCYFYPISASEIVRVNPVA